jgi:hypothetical protein
MPSAIVEPVIAASIVIVALQNLLRPQSTHSRARLLVAFGFGLVHGLGFAGGLLDAMEGLPSLGIWIALLAFSIGVEVGHQVVVLPLFSALAASRRNQRSLPAAGSITSSWQFMSNHAERQLPRAAYLNHWAFPDHPSLTFCCSNRITLSLKIL